MEVSEINTIDGRKVSRLQNVRSGSVDNELCVATHKKLFQHRPMSRVDRDTIDDEATPIVTG
jgi:hypothetical protein